MLRTCFCRYKHLNIARYYPLDNRASASVRDAPCRFDHFDFILCLEKCFTQKSRQNKQMWMVNISDRHIDLPGHFYDRIHSLIHEIKKNKTVIQNA